MPKSDDQRASQAEHDARRAAAKPWRSWYSSARWKATRRGQLQAEPLCAFCAELGAVTPAVICDHVQRHGGDPERFWRGPFQSLCKVHHDRTKQSDELRGYSTAIGISGWPADPRHPANAGTVARRDRSAKGV
jgi:5-methylcytosine-specific restriction enzyme A